MGLWARRLSADGYATMHPQCAEGPRPGVVPGTRAFDGGGVDVICSSRRRGRLRGARGAPFPFRVAGGVIVSRTRCTTFATPRFFREAACFVEAVLFFGRAHTATTALTAAVL